MTHQEAIHTTYKQIGIRSQKQLAKHILLENAYENNLVPDISSVDYLQENKGPIKLQPVSSPFVDDFYVYGYLRKQDIVLHKGKATCTLGELGSAKITIQKIQNILRETQFGLVGETLNFINTAIAHTVAYPSRGRIGKTISEIEGTNKQTWVSINGEPAAVFVAKLDVSNIPLEQVERKMPDFVNRLRQIGYNIYSIDFTQDFAGTLDTEKLDTHMEELGYLEEGEEGQREGTILDTSHCGKHVFSYIEEWNGYTVRNKLYNKIVSNLEAGEIRENFGGHLADYADSSSEHLQQVFSHPLVKEHGCTRIEVSIYGWDGNFCAEDAIENVLYTTENSSAFLSQPSTSQYLALAQKLDRCLVLADRPNQIIYVAWYAHTKTKRISGIQISTKIENWERAVEWVVSEFGFRCCPIFVSEILSLEPEGFDMQPLRCYYKSPNTTTTLASCRRPMQVREGKSPNLPNTETVEWVFRQKKCHHTIDKQKKIWEIDPMSTERKISLLSTRNRERKLQELEDAENSLLWKERMDEIAQSAIEYRNELQKQYELEMERILQYQEQQKEMERMGNANYILFGEKRGEPAIKKEEFSGDKATVLGYVCGINSSWMYIVCKECNLWANGHVRNILRSHNFKPFATEKKMKSYYLCGALELTLSEMGQYKNVSGIEGQTLGEEPPTPNPPLPKNMVETDCPSPAEIYKVLDMEEGEYTANKYTKKIFRGSTKIILLVQKGDGEIPIQGLFLDKEIGKIDIENTLAPIQIRIGKIRTNASKKKDRLVDIVALKNSK